MTEPERIVDYRRWATWLLVLLAVALLAAGVIVAAIWDGETYDSLCYPLLYKAVQQNRTNATGLFEGACADQDREHAAVAGGLAVAGIVAAIGALLTRARQRRR